MRKACSKLFAQNFSELLKEIDTVLTDCEGVLWQVFNGVDKVPSVIEKLKKHGKRIFFVTNDCYHTREKLLKRFQFFDFNVQKNEVVNSSFATAAYLQKLNFQKKVYIVGSKSISEELDRVGIKNCGVGRDYVEESIVETIKAGIQLDPEVGAVVVGMDELVSALKVFKAANYVNDEKCIFIGASNDIRIPTGTEIIAPGPGTILSAIEATAQRKALLIGKPAPYLFEAIRYKYNIDPKKTLMIGDSLDTDILFGNNCGMKTLLVLTGNTSLKDVEQVLDVSSDNVENNKMIPDFFIQSLGDVDEFI